MLLVYLAYGDGTCQIYGCSTLPNPEEGKPQNCVATAPNALTTNVQTCPKDYACVVAGAFTDEKIANTSCSTYTPPKPTP